MKNMSQKTVGTSIALIAVIVLSPDTLLISLIKADDFTLIFWRGLLTSITLTLSLASFHGFSLIREVKKIGMFGLLAAMFFSVSTFSFVISVRLTSAANALVIVAAMPLIAAVFTKLFLRETVPLRTWMAVVFGFSGIAVVFTGSFSGGNPFGDFLALVTAAMMAGNFVIIRRQRQVNMIPAVILSGILTTVISALISDPLAISKTDLVYLFLIGAVVLPVPLALMTVAPKLIPAAEVGLIMLLETFLGPLWVWLAIRQEPGIETILGGAVLVLTLAIHFYYGMKEEKTV